MARSRLAVALDREEIANEQLAQNNEQLDRVNTQLQVENLATRFQLIGNALDEPVYAFDAALQDIERHRSGMRDRGHGSAALLAPRVFSASAVPGINIFSECECKP